MVAEDIRDLQNRTVHGRSSYAGGFVSRFLSGLRRCQRARDVPDRVGGDMRIERGRFQMGVSEKHLDDPDVDCNATIMMAD